MVGQLQQEDAIVEVKGPQYELNNDQPAEKPDIDTVHSRFSPAACGTACLKSPKVHDDLGFSAFIKTGKGKVTF